MSLIERAEDMIKLHPSTMWTLTMAELVAETKRLRAELQHYGCSECVGAAGNE